MSLKNKNDIEDYKYKSYLLMENDFETWYHDDNWVHKSSFESPYGPDRAGASTNACFASLNFSDEEYEELKKELDETVFKPKYKNLIDNILCYIGLKGSIDK
jgi:hypothetical protein